ncbi:hypothetical protein SAMN02799624_04288 [Paenibacillus sp. UNC496MF]|uniref:hypothetical protein n=1 Tax=Paenibacillus sp. UNC496MF TaxID=1502753 RepID=UPI0008E236AA|nr:hypothetical protein [Paenibacillus sp. UNC496MF]SFJ36839.1 hypothetical protein SAMN02799624_04288 [Paenibacillus sp. UNC496MF]
MDELSPCKSIDYKSDRQEEGMGTKMAYSPLQHDADFENAHLFGCYVMVVTNEKMTGGGCIERFNEDRVVIGGKPFSRAGSSFIPMPPPQMDMSGL